MCFSSHPEIFQAISALQRGALVAYPTDTLYGLGAHAFINSAIKRVYEAKSRPEGMAIPLILSSTEDLHMVTAQTGGLIEDLTGAFWPGALTLVVRSKNDVPELVRGGGETVAVRVPDHEIPRELVRRLGAPITGTSANKTGGPDPVDSKMVCQQLGDHVEVIIDQGKSPGIGPSTIIDVSSGRPALIRLGGISQTEIESVCGSLYES